jgi:hypothetical protein
MTPFFIPPRASGAPSSHSSLTLPHTSAFRLICTYLVLQLFIGVIIESIENQTKIDSMAVTQAHIQVPMELRNSGQGKVQTLKTRGFEYAISVQGFEYAIKSL